MAHGVRMSYAFWSTLSTATQRGYGAMVARLTPDQKVGRSNCSGLIFLSLPGQSIENYFLLAEKCNTLL